MDLTTLNKDIEGIDFKTSNVPFFGTLFNDSNPLLQKMNDNINKWGKNSLGAYPKLDEEWEEEMGVPKSNIDFKLHDNRIRYNNDIELG